jgi:hypothetical protein
MNIQGYQNTKDGIIISTNTETLETDYLLLVRSLSLKKKSLQ